MKKEVWKKIPGHKNYEASSLGRIRKWEIKKGSVDKDGYPRVRISGLCAKAVHRLILMTFKPNKLCKKLQARHLNGIRKDNRISNLDWGTASENAKDRVAHGTQVRGAKVIHSRLNEDQIRDIRYLYAFGARKRTLAKHFSVHESSIGKITSRKSWSHI